MTGADTDLAHCVSSPEDVVLVIDMYSTTKPKNFDSLRSSILWVRLPINFNLGRAMTEVAL
jgi:hypothetical protein